MLKFRCISLSWSPAHLAHDEIDSAPIRCSIKNTFFPFALKPCAYNLFPSLTFFRETLAAFLRRCKNFLPFNDLDNAIRVINLQINAPLVPEIFLTIIEFQYYMEMISLEIIYFVPFYSSKLLETNDIEECQHGKK